MPPKRSKGKLIEALMAFAHEPTHGQGGWPNQIRAAKQLALEAGLELGRWGRIPAMRKAQPEDLLRSTETTPHITTRYATARHPT